MIVEFLIKHWDDCLMSAFAAVTAMSCFLYINSKPKGMKDLADKILAYLVGLGAFGLTLSPLSGDWNFPNGFELTYMAGTAVYAFFSTHELWCVRIYERAAALVHEDETHTCS